MRRTWIAVAVAALLVLAGCGGDSGSDDTAAPGPNASAGGMAGHDHSGAAVDASCSPTGTTVSVVVSGTAFQSQCLAAPANQTFTVSYDNRDSITHNIVFLESHTATQVMFRADGFMGPAQKTFTAGPFKPGTYAFHCEFHPNQMSGAFVVK